MAAIKLCAKNDINGNPRRIYVVLDKRGNIIGAVDEEYEGIGALYHRFPRLIGYIPSEFETTPREYRRLLHHTYGKG